MKGRALGSVAFALLLGMATPAAHAAAVAGRVVDADGRPVAGALVSCRPVPSAEQRLLEETRAIEAKPIAETKTDEHGLFSIRFQRDPGDLLLRVSARGLPSREMEAEADSDQPGGELEILLPESRRFSGRITDESGRPLPRVRVRVFDSRETGEGVAFGEAVTGAEGRFEVPNAPDGDVAIAARAPGLVPVLIFRSRSMTSETLVLKRGGSVEGTLRDAAGKSLAGVVVVSADAAEETDAAGHYRLDGIAIGLASVRARWKEDQARREGVVVRKGETARVDLRLGPSAVISGTIVDEKTRRPLSGVHVSASSSFAKSGRPEEVARTDARGGFRLGGLSAGSYELRAERRGYLPGGAAAAAGASSATVSLALRKAGTISGRVVDERGVAVAGARIRRLPPIGRSETFEGSSFPLSSVPSYRDGSFRMRGLPPGEASLLAQKEGWVAARRDGVGVRSGDVTKRVVLTLRRGVEAKGRVVDRTGQPIAGAEVRLWSMKNPSATVSAVADPQGSFSARGLTEGAYAAEVSARGFATKTYDALAVGKRGAAWVPFVLGPSAPISGWVRNTAGDAIAGASISSSGGTDGEEVHAQSDAEGRFRLDGWAEGRQVALEIAAEGYARLSRTVNAPTDGLTAILSAAATLRGRVEDAETQKPLESFSLGWHVPRGS
ncbi:MAG TPA: carboxypeptidase-like regulatory domain-containing protein, partial [Thermoanaerobaculia bacterium]